MPDKDPRAQTRPLAPSDNIVHVTCPVCESPKGVVAATHYSVQMCFCPACEHAWDCAKQDCGSPPDPKP